MRVALTRSHAQNVVTEISSCKQVHVLHIISSHSNVADLLTGNQLDRILADHKDKLVVIDYSTTWCGPCKLVGPKFELLSEKYSDAIFLKCTGDSSDLTASLMKRKGVRSVPAFHLWKNGKRIDVIIGAQIQELEANINANK